MTESPGESPHLYSTSGEGGTRGKTKTRYILHQVELEIISSRLSDLANYHCHRIEWSTIL